MSDGVREEGKMANANARRCVNAINPIERVCRDSAAILSGNRLIYVIWECRKRILSSWISGSVTTRVVFPPQKKTHMDATDSQ